MSGSNVEETSEQTRGREAEPIARGRGRGKKDTSRDVVANMEARLAKVELAMADTREGVDLIEQGMEKGLEDLREQIQDFARGVESRMEALTARGRPETKRFDKSWPSIRPLYQHESWPLMRHQGWRCPSHTFSGKRDAKELDNFLWHMERYFEAIALMDEATKVRTATLYLTDNATLWWRRRFADIEKGRAP
ncbi:hypothetical protein CK203_026062 [Vitis vinifera]|uniref:Retrotransposon gag domain-containing protein n=1 Tax=Vitis vinifera TaxID=29760 RepID=A0A438IJ61_VITVI|nr:hypothetical protein CK203_026062 [Vitis vinifera]